MLNQRYSRLIVTAELGKKVQVLCDCSNEKVVWRLNVLAGYTKSCGCLQREMASAVNTAHGLANKHPLYAVWKRMRRRCYDPRHHSYPWYGAKGIKLCNEWESDFLLFYRDMHEGYIEGLTIDRIDPTKDYCKENCRWITHSENSRRAHSGEAL